MKRKVKKYAGEDESLVKGSTNLRTRSDAEFDEDNKFGGYGKYMPKTKSLTRGFKETSRPSEDLAPSEPKSTMDGSTEIKEDTYKEPPSRGIASGFSAEQYLADSGPKGGGSGRTSITRPEKKKPKPKPRYSDVVSSKDLGSQDFSSKAKPASSTGGTGLSKAAMAAGLGLGAAAGAGLLASRRKMQSGTRGERVEPTMGRTTRSPVRSMTAEEASFENEGGRYLKKGGVTKKMASGGKVSSASSRGDGIAQRGKTRGKMC
jgi:hypothetical protein